MNSKILLLVILPVHMTGLTSEPMVPPRAEWQLSAGGHGNDSLTALRQTTDGGYILAGWSESPPSGNKTSPYFGGVAGDLWLVRLDSTGAILWDKSFGGDAQEGGDCSVRQTRDGGFVLASMSRSGVSGTKTSPQIGGRDFFDLWVVRLNGDGDKQWEAAFGGLHNEFFAAIEETSDGGFILGGSSESSATGNKTSPNYGSADYWIVKLSAEGARLWDNTFGGNRDDILHAVQQTPDGGFILGGRSRSQPSGNKTSLSYGGEDFWVVRLDPGGDKIWERSYGGSHSDALRALGQTTDGGFLFGGYSYSDPSGVKSSARLGDFDYWVVRVDAAGEKLWDKTYGGGRSSFSMLHSLIPLLEGGFVLAGYSDESYGMGGNKTSPSRGRADYWVVRIDPSGNLLWDQSFGGNSDDIAFDVQQSADGGIVVGGESLSNTNGNKTSPSFGARDFWVVKLAPEDLDADGVPDIADLCPRTPITSPVNSSGCSIGQLCPCDEDWKDHGEFVSCVAHTASAFLNAGLISQAQRQGMVREAASSDCGK